MKEYNDCDEQVLSLIINYPEFLDETIIQDVYLKPRQRILFNILKEEYSRYKEFIIENLLKHKDFEIDYYSELLDSNVYNSSRKIKFKEFEKYLIDRYKNEMVNKLVREYNGNPEDLYSKLIKVREINYNENEYIKANEMYEVMSKKNEKINIGFVGIDKSLNFSKNDLLIIAGGTGTGKTAFALNLLVNLSENYQCIYFNQEMSPNIIYRRMTAIKSGVDIRKLRDMKELTIVERKKINYALSKFEEEKIILVNKVVDLQEIENSISYANSEKHIIVIIDHIGLIKSKGKSLYERMTEIAKELRRISMNYNCTIIGLCQLSREGQKGERKPVLQDLRDSGEIEQSARKVILLYNPNPSEEAIQDMELIIGKNDDGDKLIKQFKFDKYKQIFYEI